MLKIALLLNAVQRYCFFLVVPNFFAPFCSRWVVKSAFAAFSGPLGAGWFVGVVRLIPGYWPTCFLKFVSFAKRGRRPNLTLMVLMRMGEWGRVMAFVRCRPWCGNVMVFFLSRTRALYKVCFCGGRVVVACLSNVDW